jgi:hypothetical protein
MIRVHKLLSLIWDLLDEDLKNEVEGDTRHAQLEKAMKYLKMVNTYLLATLPEK